ncbi:hypothetical protein ACROYT_G010370 [Oculina patagonica]
MSRSTKGRKCTETTSGDSKHADEPSNCIICLEKVACRGKLSVCNHWFCFPCILEWSENTNTCPICKARFRCITKVHLSLFRSPPTKVRVGDRDQRVWNDDDTVVAEDVLGAIDSDDVDDDYEPPTHVENPWTRTTRRQNDRRGNSQTSRQLHLDDYDYEDSFIDDTDEALQAYLHATYSQQALDIIDEDGEESDSGESSDDNIGQRTSPYRFRNGRAAQTRSSRNARNSFASLPQIEEESPCPSPASIGSFIVSDDDSPDELNNDWVPFGNHSKNSRNKGKSKVKAKKDDSKKRKRPETSRSNPSTRRTSQPLHRPKKQQEPKQRSSNSKRKRHTSVSEDEFQLETSRSRSDTNQASIDGWISMAAKRAKAHSSTSTTTNQRTVREQACKGKKPIKNGESSYPDELYDSSSDSEIEVLSVRINQGRHKHARNSKEEKKHERAVNNHNLSRTSLSTRETRKKQNNKFCASTSTSVETHEDACSVASVDEDDFSNVAFIQPTPQPDKKRSIFTRRQHRSPNASFDDLEDNAMAVSRAETRPNKSSLTNHQAKTNSSHEKKDTALADKSNIQLEISPLVKKKKQPRKRVRSLSSDSE